MNTLEEITYEILAKRALTHFDSKKLVDWALEVLSLGQESENLYILAGLDDDTTEEREEYFWKSINDLKLNISKSDEELIENYAELIAKKAIDGEMDIDYAFEQMWEIAVTSEYDKKYESFLYILHIDEDLYNLEYENFAMYCTGMTLENYREYILEEFEIFLETKDLNIPNKERDKCYCLNCKQFTSPKMKTKRQLFKKPFKINVWICEFCKSEKLKFSQDHFVKRLLIEKYKNS